MVKRKKNRLLTDAFREIHRTRNRFLSLFVLSALLFFILRTLKRKTRLRHRVSLKCTTLKSI